MLNLRVEEKDAAYLMGLLQATRNRTQEQLDEGRSIAPELLRESIDNIDRLLDEINEQFYRKARDLD